MSNIIIYDSFVTRAITADSSFTVSLRGGIGMMIRRARGEDANELSQLLEFQIQDFKKEAEHEERKVVTMTASIDHYENINEIVKEGQDEHAEALPTIFAKVDVVMPIDYYQQLLNDKNSEVLVAKLNGQIVGFAVLEIKEAPPFAFLVSRKYAYISDFGVKKSISKQRNWQTIIFCLRRVGKRKRRLLA
jgi:hypothetical protein